MAISNKLEIFSYCICSKCFEEWEATRPGVSPSEFGRLNVGFTPPPPGFRSGACGTTSTSCTSTFKVSNIRQT